MPRRITMFAVICLAALGLAACHPRHAHPHDPLFGKHAYGHPGKGGKHWQHPHHREQRGKSKHK